MSTITKFDKAGRFGQSPYGNQTVYGYHLETDSTGAVVNADSTSAVAIGDVIVVGVIPAGFKLIDSQIIISNAFTDSATAKVGFAYVDGTDSTDVPQDDDYFGSGLVLSTAARLRNATSNAPVTLPKDAYLIVTTAGAALAEVGIADIFLAGEIVGTN